ncbi:hypothetical protein [Paenarthrobacter aurescens]|uniref:Uncharacterized protein n=1 Tax=Paenarthrobacter aurescens TaxID=43663 RepID=A0A4Y3NDS9_PAEAU|nr:hypothetical protein [Paenarthrobacter aurescens]MDO6145534.1 hypothetical protein [Paenarthrobacter aurescens]MDO6149343.1 hypothetical protein [Paenarthrobacter aurescens]MDO6160583.1 hypothetical protein [Paenarthrobacter aurescens]MDO6164442.1 hypothetical protein [Paenarthrobacter aurescens]GEB19980.1 hypothetical protein AAU01_27350 [Paenarthrobacter aurescens]
MNPIEEKIQLPDPDTQFLVHPVDLPGARKEFLTGWWLGIVATPQVYTALLAFFWAVSNNYVTPVLVPLVMVVIAGWVSSKLTRGAWDYIPRKRHDKERQITFMTIAASLITSLALFAALLIFMAWTVSQDLVPGFSAYPLGMGAAIVVIMAGELLVKLMRHRSVELASDAISLVVVAGAVGLGFGILPAGRELAPLDLLPGAAILLGVWLTWLLFTKNETRRNHS